MDRALIPPLTIVLTLTTAIALLVMALTLSPRPGPAALPAALAADGSPPSPVVAVIGASPPRAPAVSLARARSSALPPAPRAMELARLPYQPGAAGVRQTLPGPLLLVVDAGALGVRLDAPGRLHRANLADPAAFSDCLGACRLSVGDSLLVPGRGARCGPGGDGALGRGDRRRDWTRRRGARRRCPAALESGLVGGGDGDAVGGGWAVDLDAPAATLALVRISLAPGEEVALPARGAQALAVETGALTLTTEDGLVWLQRPGEGDEWLGSNTPATLLGGEGALLQAGASGRLRNDGGGPVEVLILTVAPVEAPTLGYR